MYCSNCGYKMDDQAKFCARCGTPAANTQDTVQQNQSTSDGYHLVPNNLGAQNNQNSHAGQDNRGAGDHYYYYSQNGASYQGSANASYQGSANAGYQGSANAGSSQADGAGIGGFVCSLIGLVVFPLILGIIGLVLSNKSIAAGSNSGLAKAGRIIGIIDIVWGVIWFILVFAALL